MVLYFTGTGNSRYLARRIAEGLEMPLYDLNACIKAGDTVPVQTGPEAAQVLRQLQKLGILPPATSAMLHNLSTLGISLRSMTDLLEQKSSL